MHLITVCLSRYTHPPLSPFTISFIKCASFPHAHPQAAHALPSPLLFPWVLRTQHYFGEIDLVKPQHPCWASSWFGEGEWGLSLKCSVAFFSRVTFSLPMCPLLSPLLFSGLLFCGISRWILLMWDGTDANSYPGFCFCFLKFCGYFPFFLLPHTKCSTELPLNSVQNHLLGLWCQKN